MISFVSLCQIIGPGGEEEDGRALNSGVLVGVVGVEGRVFNRRVATAAAKMRCIPRFFLPKNYMLLSHLDIALIYLSLIELIGLLGFYLGASLGGLGESL